LSAKFTNDSNFFVREVGRGRGLLERSLENCRSVVRGRKEMMKTESRFARRPILEKMFAKIYLVCLLMGLTWRQIQESPANATVSARQRRYSGAARWIGIQ